MKLTNEMIVAIIGAGAAIIGATFSTISIILSNKNSKKIKKLDNSENVKKNIAEKRYSIYKNIIDYINTYYNIEHYYEHNYKKCKAKLYSISINRLSNKEKMVAELEKIKNLTCQYFYLDKKTYWLLKAMESYLEQVITYISTEKIENFNMFSSLIYNDLWNYLLLISKPVNKFISNEDILNFSPSKKFNYKLVNKLFLKTKFYRVFYVGLKDENIAEAYEDARKKAKKELTKIERLTTIAIKKDINPKAKQKALTTFKKARKIALNIMSEQPPKRVIKSLNDKVYKRWKLCISCNNIECPLHKNFHTDKSTLTVNE